MDELKKKLEEVQNWLSEAYTSIRTGQATPALLDTVKAESYGTKMPLNQLGSVGVEDARTLRISPWDAGTISAIEKAIEDADLGVSVSTDSTGLRVKFPELTSERREQLLKTAKQKLEDARVSVRAARDEAVKEIEAQLKNGDITEDDKFTMKDEVQKLVDETNKKLEELFNHKEEEIGK